MDGSFLPPVVTRLEAQIDDVLAKIEEVKTAMKTLKTGVTVPVNFELNKTSWAKAQATAQGLASKGITVPVRFDVNTASAASAGIIGRALTGAGGAAGGFWSWIMRLGRTDLFGGVLPGILASVGGIHLLIDGIAEVGAVVIPAIIALGGFGIAASDAVNNVIRQFSAIHEVMDATGQAIPPMTNALENLHKAVQPQVYSMLGDALTVISDKGGEFTGIIKGASDALSYFAARITVALTSQGMSSFLRNAVGDVRGIFNIFGNLAGTIGAVLKNLPGYAQVFLNVLQNVTHGIEVFANTGLGQGIIKFGMAFHGAFIYLGLLGTAAARIIPMVLGWVTKLGDTAALQAVRLGFTRIADGLGAFSGAAEGAAALPWGWIGLVAAGIGVLAYKILTAKSATQQYTAAMQTNLGNQSAGLPLFNKLVTDQVSTIGKLASAQINLSKVSAEWHNVAASSGNAVANIAVPAYAQLANRAADMTSRQKILSDETNLYNYRLGILANKYGGTTEAQNLLTQAGVKGTQMLDKSSQAWKIIQQMVSGVVQGYAAMGQRSGTLGADLFIITQQASDQYQAMQKLNQAWQTFTGQTSQLQSSAETVIQSMRTLTTEANKAGASFTGVNARSITLQGTFENQLYPQLQNVIGGMRQGGASSTDLAKVISTMLSPAVHEGALQNQGLRTQIYDMARQAGYTGPNAIRPLTGFIDNNRESLYTAMQAVDRYTRALGNIPNPENLKIYVHGVGQWQAPRGMAARPGFNAKGGLVAGGTPGRDSVLSWLMPGEVVVPTNMVHAGAVDHLRGKLPRFASGGIVPNYSGNVAGLTPWTQNNYAGMETAFANALSKTFPAMQNAMGGPGGGRTSAGGRYNRSMLENLWQQAGGPGGYIALIAAAIALAESSGNPLARNPSGASGLWQILGQVVPGNIFNPFTNALNAVSKFDSAHGFSPWVTYTTGAYRQFLDNGGWLQPGNTLVTNNTGQPERVLAPGEHEAIELHVYLDGKEITQNVQMRARRYNRRNGPRGTQSWDRPA